MKSYNLIINLTYILIVILTFSVWEFKIHKLDLKKSLVLVAAETCLVDSVILYYTALILKGEFNRVFGVSKREAWYLKPFSNNLIFIDRDKRLDQVKEIVKRITQLSEPFILFIFPEGTTKRTDRWKTGFHYIAHKTNSNIGIIGIDHKKKMVNIDKIFVPSKNCEKNIKYIKKRLRKYQLAIPQNSNLD